MAGRTIAVTASNRRKLAHILQGAETAMLRVVARELGEEIEVLQHDGWTTATRLDRRRLTRLIYQETGYRMRIEEKRLTVNVPRPGEVAPLEEPQRTSPIGPMRPKCERLIQPCGSNS